MTKNKKNHSFQGLNEGTRQNQEVPHGKAKTIVQKTVSF